MGQEVILLPLFDYKGRILSETDLATNTKSEYTYDNLLRVINRKITNLSDNSVTEENYTYDANGNILSSAVNTDNATFEYDANNRLTKYNGQAVTYDLDGNMLNANGMALTYDSANRLLSAGGNTYTYDVENTRVKNLCNGVETQYSYNTNAGLSQLLVKTTGSTVTKYVYGNGLIGEETNNTFKTYHFDYRGSTVAITDSTGTVTDTFTYDSYGNVVSRTGTTDVIFLYNGKYGVVTDTNSLLYMRARYYSSELRRFINADILMGDIDNSATLNRYAYANGNPISNIDPFGLAADSRGGSSDNKLNINDFKNADGSYSLYDNLRNNPHSIFHEQILSGKFEKLSLDLKNGDLTLGTASLSIMSGGWEFDHLDLSLLDIGNAKLSAGLKDYKFDLTAIASAYSPSVTIKIGKIQISLSGEIGAIGGSIIVDPKSGRYSIKGAYGFGFGVSIGIK